MGGCAEKEGELVDVLKRVVASLSAEHRSLVAYISAMLLKVAAHADTNKMGLSNLATVFAPSLLRGVAPRPPCVHWLSHGRTLIATLGLW
jgi:hypothetical protein